MDTKKKSKKYIIGVDEAGRGPLAGPVSIGTVMFLPDFNQRSLKEIKNKDSKKLSEAQREVWFEKIKIWKKEKKLDFAVSLISENIIDKKGISFAIKKGIEDNLKKLNASPKDCFVLLDGSLKAPKRFKFQKTIIKGDEKIPIISLASIAAKVTRDKKMKKIAKIYPKYGFDIHKGYGTLIHRQNIKKYGVCDIHRHTFLRNMAKA